MPTIACTSHSFGIASLEAAAQIIKALGFEGIDFVAATFPQQLDPFVLAEHPEREADRLRSICDRIGLVPTALFAAWRIPLSTPHQAERDDLVRSTAAAARLCRRAGIAHLQTSIGRLHPDTPDERRLEVVAATIRRVRDAVEQVGGIRYLVEAQRGAAISTPEDTLRLVEAVPGLQINLDPGQYASIGYPVESYSPLYAHSPHVHMRQARQGALQERLESGDVDFREVVQGLQAQGFSGVYSTEYVHFANVPDCSSVDVVTETVKMRDLILEELERTRPAS